jgi:hypothetical protein
MKKTPYEIAWSRKEGRWNRRIYDVAGAMGWSFVEMARGLGFSTRQALSRILEGGLPRVEAILKLEQLESTYEREITTYIRGHRPRKLYRRKFLEGTLHPHLKRPEDIAEMGKVGTNRAAERLKRRTEAYRARRTARKTLTTRRLRQKNKKARIRQSYVEWKRQRAFDRKLKQTVNAIQKEDKGA